MKIYLIILWLLIVKIAFPQDLTDEKNFKKIKNVQSYSHNKGNYSVTLKDGSSLKIEYTILINDQYNADYMFVPKTTSKINNQQSFFSAALNGFYSYGYDLGLSQFQLSQIKTRISEQKQDFKKNLVLIDLPCDNYDEANLSIEINRGTITYSFFFRRWL